MTCVATDADGDSLIYDWSCDGGSISGTSAVEVWTAPSAAGTYTVTCTVSDGTDSDAESKLIEVTAIPNAKPVINFLTAEPDTVLIKHPYLHVPLLIRMVILYLFVVLHRRIYKRH
jgi:hypothetical protein